VVRAGVWDLRPKVASSAGVVMGPGEAVEVASSASGAGELARVKVGGYERRASNQGGASKRGKIRARALKKRFLLALAGCGRVSMAARQAKVPVGTVWGSWRQDADFVAAFELARSAGEEVLSSDCFEEVGRRALEEYNDLLLIFMMKRLDPRFKDNHSVNIGVSGPGSVQIILEGGPEDPDGAGAGPGASPPLDPEK